MLLKRYEERLRAQQSRHAKALRQLQSQDRDLRWEFKQELDRLTVWRQSKLIQQFRLLAQTRLSKLDLLAETEQERLSILQGTYRPASLPLFYFLW